MRSFKFNATTKSKQDFLPNLCTFLDHISQYYEQQLLAIQKSNLEFEKMFHTNLKSEKENQFMKKISNTSNSGSNPNDQSFKNTKQDNEPVEPEKSEIIKKIDEDILKTIIKAEQTLKEVDEKPSKPVKATLKPYMQNLNTQKKPPSSNASKINQNKISEPPKPGLNKHPLRSNSVSKPIDHSTNDSKNSIGKPGSGSGVKNDENTTTKKNYHFLQGKTPENLQANQKPEFLSKASTPSNNKLPQLPIKGGKNDPKLLTKDNTNANTINLAEASTHLQGNPLANKILANYFSHQEEIKNEQTESTGKAPIQIASFKTTTYNLIKKQNIETYTNIKKTIKQRINDFTENAKYHGEKEKKAKGRFLSKLNSHIGNAKKVWMKTLDFKEDIYKLDLNQYNTLKKEDAINYSTCKTLIKLMKNIMILENPELKNIIYSTTMLDSKCDNEIDFDNRLLNVFRSWYYMNFLDESMKFIIKELEKFTKLEVFKEMMLTAARIFTDSSTIKYTIIESYDKKSNENNENKIMLNLGQIIPCQSSTNLASNNNNNNKPGSNIQNNIITEYQHLKKLIKINLKNKAFTNSSESQYIKINIKIYQEFIVKTIKDYILSNYPLINNNNTSLNKEEDLKTLLKYLRIMYYLVDEKNRLPNFMMITNNPN